MTKLYLKLMSIPQVQASEVIEGTDNRTKLPQ